MLALHRALSCLSTAVLTLSILRSDNAPLHYATTCWNNFALASKTRSTSFEAVSRTGPSLSRTSLYFLLIYLTVSSTLSFRLSLVIDFTFCWTTCATMRTTCVWYSRSSTPLSASISSCCLLMNYFIVICFNLKISPQSSFAWTVISLCLFSFSYWYKLLISALRLSFSSLSWSYRDLRKEFTF